MTEQEAILLLKTMQSDFMEASKEDEEALSLAISALEEQMNGGWIPCSVVDHPEHCHDCEVTIKTENGVERTIGFYTDRWLREADEADIDAYVIAWKEPSKPYLGRKEDKQ